MSTGAAILQPTYAGHVPTTQDALILFEACLSGHLNLVPRRPRDHERNSLICSGCVFIYEERASGIKRWTDGVTWSPSRVLDDFLVYRELNQPFPPGEKKRVNKKTSRQLARPGELYPRLDSTGEFCSPTIPHSTSSTNTPTPSGAERQLIGSLTDSYGFKPNGLVKKTMNATVRGVAYHLVSYYNMDHVKTGTLEQPSQAQALSSIRPRSDLTLKQIFRAPSEETMDSARNCYSNSNFYHPHSAYCQHCPQPEVSAGYSPGPTMGGNFMPQMAPSQIPPREYAGFNQSPYNQNYEPLHNDMRPSLHPSSIPPAEISVLPPGYPDRPPSQMHHPVC
jgi:Gti1/Pac2 family transcription factor